MTRVLIIEPAGNLFGSERALLDFVSIMPDIEVAVCCPPQTPIIAELENISVSVFPYFVYGLHEKTRLQRVWAALGILRACYQFRPEVLYLNQGGCYRVALIAAVIFNLPIVSHVRIFDDVAYFAKIRPDPLRLRGLVTISLAVASEFHRHPELAAIRKHVLYDPYKPAIAANESKSTQSVTHRIACVGRIEPRKGQDLLIRAILLLGELGYNIECLMIGDGSKTYVQQLKSLAKHASIKWCGIQKEIVPLLRTCAVMACPFTREGLGRVVFEAWDAGTIPIAWRSAGGIAEIITAADGGILYEEPTPESLATMLLRAMKLPQLESSRLINNGRSWIFEHCDPHRYAQSISKILRDAPIAR
jgi:glycosyltransferase involved in cell wall biosynthesis